MCGLLLLAPALLLAACQHDPLLPDEERFAPVAMPSSPPGEARCDDDNDGEFEPCLSEAQADLLFNAVVDTLCAANDKLAWLSDFYLGTRLPPSCRALSNKGE